MRTMYTVYEQDKIGNINLKAIFPNAQDAFEYANHMCYPGIWDVEPELIERRPIKKKL